MAVCAYLAARQGRHTTKVRGAPLRLDTSCWAGAPSQVALQSKLTGSAACGLSLCACFRSCKPKQHPHNITCFAALLQAAAAESSGGHAPVVVRNAGTMGSRDLHLENFSVSNGGQDLIEVRNLLPALALGVCKTSCCHRQNNHSSVCS